jgi:putative ABC transport system permease protein
MLLDLRFALRLLATRRGFTVAVVLTLALGIGANTAVYSVIDAVLLRPAPVSDLDNLVMVWQTDRATGTMREPSSVPDFIDLRARTTTLAKVAAFMAAEANLARTGVDPERIAVLRVTPGLFDLLGMTPLAGRPFTEDDSRPGRPDVVTISATLARRLFDGPDGAIGKTLTLDEAPATIVAVVPDATDFGVLQILSAAAYARSFADRGAALRVDAWSPLELNPQALPRSTHPIFQIGRIVPGLPVNAAHTELQRIGADLERAYPQSNRNRGFHVERLADVVFGPVRPILAVLMAAVIAVLLIACVNVANLMLARGAERTTEVAVRSAVGASLGRLLRQFLTESITLTIAAGLIGVGVGVIGVRALLALAPADVPRLTLVSLDGNVLGAALVVVAAVAVAFGVLPTLQAQRVNLAESLSGDGGRATADPRRVRLRRGLVVAEMAIAVTLLTGAGLLIRSFWNLQRVDTGFRPDGVLKAEFQLPVSRYPANFARFPSFPEQQAFMTSLLERVRALPGVTHAALAGHHPLDPGFTNSFRITGREAEGADWPEISVRSVSAEYFSTVRLPLVRGRGLEAADVTNPAQVAVINDAAARRFFGDRDPLGSEISFWGIRRRIVGVVANERFKGLSEPPAIAVYVPLASASAQVLLVRTNGDPLPLAASVRAAIREQDRQLAVFGLEPLAATVTRKLSEQRFAMLLVTAFASIALLLAAVGVYGVLNYDVTLRTREIGLRLALGAQPLSILRLIVGQALVLVGLALTIGVAGAVGAGLLLSALLFGIGSGDPLTIASVAGVLGFVALLASALPARRAARTEPVVALRR